MIGGQTKSLKAINHLSVIDSGCMMYGFAANTSLKTLDKIQYQVLRLWIGIVKTTPTGALQVEMGKMESLLVF